MKTVVGLFDTYAHAESASHDLENAGIPHNDISLVANNIGLMWVAIEMATLLRRLDP